MPKNKQLDKEVLVDDLDKKILNRLLLHGRDSMRDIASVLRVSPATVMHRMRFLTKQVIKHFSVVLEYDKLGYDVNVIISIRISKGRLFDVEKKLSHHPNVQAVYDTTGDFDAVLIARFPTTRKMDAFLKKLQTYDFVERTRTSVILNTIKEEAVKLS